MIYHRTDDLIGTNEDLRYFIAGSLAKGRAAKYD